MQVFEAMTTRVDSLREDESVEVDAIVQLFRKHRHVPIVDTARHVVGMLTANDLLASLHEWGGTGAFRVGDVMRHPAVTIRQDESLDSTVVQMREKGIHALAVVDAERRLVGIMTDVDVLIALSRDIRRGID